MRQLKRIFRGNDPVHFWYVMDGGPDLLTAARLYADESEALERLACWYRRGALPYHDIIAGFDALDEVLAREGGLLEDEDEEFVFTSDDLTDLRFLLDASIDFDEADPIAQMRYRLSALDECQTGGNPPCADERCIACRTRYLNRMITVRDGFRVLTHCTPLLTATQPDKYGAYHSYSAYDIKGCIQHYNAGVVTRAMRDEDLYMQLPVEMQPLWEIVKLDSYGSTRLWYSFRRIQGDFDTGSFHDPVDKINNRVCEATLENRTPPLFTRDDLLTYAERLEGPIDQAAAHIKQLEVERRALFLKLNPTGPHPK